MATDPPPPPAVAAVVGTPATGGTLNMLGAGDVDYMDPNISYYSIEYLNLRMWSRQHLRKNGSSW